MANSEIVLDSPKIAGVSGDATVRSSYAAGLPLKIIQPVGQLLEDGGIVLA